MEAAVASESANGRSRSAMKAAVASGSAAERAKEAAVASESAAGFVANVARLFSRCA